MVKILDFNCEKLMTKSKLCMLYVFFDLHLFGFSLEIQYIFHKPLCSSSTIFLPMVTLQQPLKNKNLSRM